MQFIREQEFPKIAGLVAKGSMFPAWRGKVDEALLVIYVGHSLGLNWVYSLSNITVINGRPVVWGDAMMALCQKSGLVEYCNETFDHDTMTASCEVKRIGQRPQVRTFSKAEAERARLWNKGVWSSYPERMLQMRARGFALRDVFPDALQGLGSAEEVQDYSVQDAHVQTIAPSSKSAALMNKGKFAQESDFEIRRDKILKRLDELDVTQDMVLSHFDIESIDEMTQDILDDMIEMGKALTSNRQTREVQVA